MTEELELKLVEKYPTILKDYRGNCQQTCMAWGMECGDGWFDILDNLCGFITNLQKSRSYFLPKKNGEYIDFHCPDVTFVQIKEKYGTLRVYWRFAEWDYEELASQIKDSEVLDKHINSYFDTIENAIDFCDYLSSKTCEVTGRPGKLYSKGWSVTLCKEEAIKRFGFDPDDEVSEDI